MYIKIHETYRKVVALCDSDLIGKKFEENIKQLEVKDGFFKGMEIAEENAIEMLQDLKKDDATFNIVGKKSVETALKAGIIAKGNIGSVQGIPFALVLF